MKRRRQQLQVSTFPFLAVLLCAMGALILVLLTMDRKAKLAALQKAQEAERDRAAAHARLLANRAAAQQARARAARAEWEGKREALRRRLDGEEKAARAELEQAQVRLDAIARKLQAEEQNARGLKQRLQSEKVAVAQQERELAAARRKASDLEKLRLAAEREKARLAAELTALERSLLEARAAKEKRSARYSVVPYFGRQGGDRRPVYVECGPAGVVFHPDKKCLGAGASPTEVRAELERRLATQKGAEGAAEGKRPYLMLLVRPEGIARYYEMQSQARELKVEFGYELINAEWKLDYTHENGPARKGGSAPASEKGPGRLAGPRLGAPSGAGREPGGTSGLTPPNGASTGGMPSEGGRAMVSLSRPQPFGGGADSPRSSGTGGATTATGVLPGLLGPALPGPSAGSAGQGKRPDPGALPTGKEPPSLPGDVTKQHGSGEKGEKTKSASGPAGARSAPAASHGEGPSLGPSLGNDPPARREVSLRPAAISGDVETVIYVECRRDRVVMYPSARTVAIDSLNHSPAHNPLLRAVQQMVARRQALARPGGPAPRVQVRFLVHRDGVETYHMAYPALGPVAGEKKAYWLKPEDEVGKIVAGR